MARSENPLLMLLGGIVTCALAVGVAVLLERWTGYAIYSFTLWFIFPLGALFTGALAASGFRFGAERSAFYPGRGMRLVVVTLCGATLVAIHFSNYLTLTVAQTPIRDVISFGEYLRFVLTQSRHTLITSHGSTAALGAAGGWGYASAAIQLVGFLAAPILFADLPEPSQTPLPPDVELHALVGRAQVLALWAHRRAAAQLCALPGGLALVPLTDALVSEMPSVEGEIAALSFFVPLVRFDVPAGQAPRAALWQDGRARAVEKPAALLQQQGIAVDRYRDDAAWLARAPRVEVVVDPAHEARLWSAIDKALDRLKS